MTMKLIALILIALVAVEHIYILWIEMFAWTTKGRTTFKTFPAELFEPTKGLAANQGLYNGFLAAGLIWALLIGDAVWAKNVAIFFLSCVVIAGLYGGFTASKAIFTKQMLPAVIALTAVLAWM
jgi:putative membrane protein